MDCARLGSESGMNQRKENVILCDIPLEWKVKRVTPDGLELLSSGIVGYTNYWNLQQRRWSVLL
jgi:hypothetical protein